ncbi:MAG TPA: hypothetical protein VIH43_04070 [Chthoniobacterales bacterium]|jgi:hypothetical protein
MKTHTANTYDLIMESEDKNRTVVETVIYALFILSAIVSIFQFVVQPIVVPSHTPGFALNQTSQSATGNI